MKPGKGHNLEEWLQRKQNVYASPDAQNELLNVMSLQILREIATELQRSPFLKVMVDEPVMFQTKTKCMNYSASHRRLSGAPRVCRFILCSFNRRSTSFDNHQVTFHKKEPLLWEVARAML